jgi:hypothetical protein
MKLNPRRQWALVTALAVCGALTPARAFAEEHVVPLSELSQEGRAAAASRAGNLADVRRVLSLPAAQDALRKAQVNTGQMNRAIAQLSDDELSQLAAKARSAEQDVQGGLIVGLLALIGLIVVILVVVSVVS